MLVVLSGTGRPNEAGVQAEHEEFITDLIRRNRIPLGGGPDELDLAARAVGQFERQPLIGGLSTDAGRLLRQLRRGRSNRANAPIWLLFAGAVSPGGGLVSLGVGLLIAPG